MMNNSFENIQEGIGVNPAELASFIQKYPELAITGSVAFYLQTGLSLDESIEKANDIDIFCDGSGSSNFKELTAKLSTEEKRVVVIKQQERFEFQTHKEDFIAHLTEYGPIQLVPIKIMATIDLERAIDFLEREEYKFNMNVFKKHQESLNRYIEVLEDDNLKEKIESTIKEFSKHIE